MLFESIAFGALAGFASSNALETALMTLSLTQEKRLAAQLPRKGMPFWMARWYGQAFESWKRHPLPFLMATLIFNSAFSMLWCIAVLSQMRHVFWAPFLIGTLLFLAGELIPKVLARRFPVAILLVLLLPFYFLFNLTQGLFAPLARHLERITHWHLPHWLYYPMNETEIKKLLADADLTKGLHPPSRFILEAMLEFASRRVRQAMRPASKVFFVNLKEVDTASLIPKMLASGYSRIPVSTDGTLDRIAGLLYVKDLLFTLATSGLVNLQDILRDCPIVEESEKLGAILSRFRQGGIHMALVKNKSGSIVGIISLEDVLEEFIGEIQDEFSPAPKNRVF